MWYSAATLFLHCVMALEKAALALVLPAAFFAALAILTKGLGPALSATKLAFHEIRMDLSVYVLDSLIVGPFLVLIYVFATSLADDTSLRLVDAQFWNRLPPTVVALAAVVAADFIGYWRHRLEHTRFLWPAHALHHSNTDMTWLTTMRFHPINRLSTFIIDNSILILLGFPAYALVAYTVVKHYYGLFVHADLPWDYGRLGRIFVSPVMHRWHHSIDEEAYQTNFATVFSIFDRIFGTYRVPGFAPSALGVATHIDKPLIAQLLYPFKPSVYRRPSQSYSDDRHHKFVEQ